MHGCLYVNEYERHGRGRVSEAVPERKDDVLIAIAHFVAIALFAVQRLLIDEALWWSRQYRLVVHGSPKELVPQVKQRDHPKLNQR